MFRGATQLFTVSRLASTALLLSCTNQAFEVGSVDAIGSSFVNDVRGSSEQPSSSSAPLAGSAPTGGTPAGGSAPIASGGSGPVEMVGAGGADPGPPAPTGMQLDSLGWIATASDSFPDEDPTSVLDGQPGSRWTTGKSQYSGMWFQIDMRKPQFFYEIDIVGNESPSEVPLRLDVYTSLDGAFGDPVARGVLGSEVINVVFAEPQYARYIRLVLTQDAGKWWSINSITVKR